MTLGLKSERTTNRQWIRDTFRRMASGEAPDAGQALAVAGSVGDLSEHEILGKMKKAMVYRVKYRKSFRAGSKWADKRAYKFRPSVSI